MPEETGGICKITEAIERKGDKHYENSIDREAI